MGSYTDLATELGLYDDGDNSFPPPEAELLWRLDDLTARLSEIKEKEPQNESEDRISIFNGDDIRYALPEDMQDISHIERAIEIAKEDLLTKYGIDVDDLIEKRQTEKEDPYNRKIRIVYEYR